MSWRDLRKRYPEKKAMWRWRERWNDIATSQGTSQKLNEAENEFSLGDFRGSVALLTFWFWIFWSPELCKNKFLLFCGICYSSPRELTWAGTVPLTAVTACPPTCPRTFNLAVQTVGPSWKQCEVLILRGLVSVFSWTAYPKGRPKPKKGYQNTTAMQIRQEGRGAPASTARSLWASYSTPCVSFSHLWFNTYYWYLFSRPILEKRKLKLEVGPGVR